MSTSGTYQFNPSNWNVVLGAYGRLQIRPAAIVQSHMLDAQRELNLLFVEWSNKQVNLWKVDLQTINLLPGMATYSVDPSTVMILDAYITIPGVSSLGPIDRYITPFSRTEYATIAAKQTPGPPTVYWFDRLMNPTVTLWPVPDNTQSGNQLNFFRCLRSQDANLANPETPDAQYRWLDAMTAGLAMRLSWYYKPEMTAIRQADYKDAWYVAAKQDTENVRMTIAPAIGMYYRR
jgi:hypothetical protein